MQGQLLVTQIETEHLGQVVIGVVGQGQLDRALDIVVVAQLREIFTAMAGQQLAIEHHMILVGLTVTQFFEIDLDGRAIAQVVPVGERAIEPGAIDQLGRRHATQEVQRMGLAAKIASRRTSLAGRQIVLVLGANPGVVLQHPGFQRVGIRREVGLHRTHGLQLVIEIVPRLLPRTTAGFFHQQLAIERLGGFQGDGSRPRALAGYGSCSGLHRGHIWQLMNTLFGLQAPAWFRPAQACGPAVSLEAVKRLRLPGLPFVGKRPIA